MNYFSAYFANYRGGYFGLLEVIVAVFRRAALDRFAFARPRRSAAQPAARALTAGDARTGGFGRSAETFISPDRHAAAQE